MQIDPTPSGTVAQLIAEYVHSSGRTETEIAQDLNYTNSNVITMLMNGEIRLPINKVEPLALAIGADPVELLKKVMGEYMPDTLAALQGLLEGLKLSENERELISAYRRVAQNRDVSAVVCDKTVIAVVMVD